MRPRAPRRRASRSPVVAPLTVADDAPAVLSGGDDDSFALVLPPLPQPATTSATSGTAAKARRVMRVLPILLTPSVRDSTVASQDVLVVGLGATLSLPLARQRRVGHTACGRGRPMPRPHVEVVDARAVGGEEDGQEDDGGNLEHDRQRDRGSVAVLLEAEQAA